jgi:predicted outer membrane protein
MYSVTSRFSASTSTAAALALMGSTPLALAHDNTGGIHSKPTAALRVNASVHNPLLCVAKVFKVASGDLSLPGKVNK